MNLVLKKEFLSKLDKSPRTNSSDIEYSPSFHLYEYRKGFSRHEGSSGNSLPQLALNYFKVSATNVFLQQTSPRLLVFVLKTSKMLNKKHQLKCLP